MASINRKPIDKKLKNKPITSEEFKTKLCPVRKDERPVSCGPCSNCGSYPWIDG